MSMSEIIFKIDTRNNSREKMENNLEIYREVVDKKVKRTILRENNEILKLIGEKLFEERKVSGEELFKILDEAIKSNDVVVAEKIVDIIEQNFDSDILKIINRL